MAEIHVSVGPNDKSGTQIVFHNPDGSNGSQPGPASDNPVPSKTPQTTVKVVGTPGVVVRFSSPA